MILSPSLNSFQHFSNSYTLRDEHCHCLTSDAAIMVSYKFPITGKQAAIIYFTIATILPAKNTLNFSNELGDPYFLLSNHDNHDKMQLFAKF